MWLVVVNPKAGLGAAAKLATQVVGFLKSNEISYRMISPNSAAETKAQVMNFLIDHPEMAILDISKINTANSAGHLDDGTVQLWTHRNKSDSMFMALLQKIG